MPVSDDPADARETVQYRGRSLDLVPSEAVLPLMPTIPSQRMTWELRATDEPDLLFGYIAVDGPEELYAFDPAAFEFGIGVACRSREEAIAMLLDDALPEIGTQTIE
jgi:hypothetical protein